MVDVYLHRVYIRLYCSAKEVQRYWQRLFENWPNDGSEEAMVQLDLSLTEALPILPDGQPFFVDSGNLPNHKELLSAYRQADDGVLLHFMAGALVAVPLLDERPFLTGHILPQALNYGCLEDITFTSLAPFLRRQGYYLVHAFGVCLDGRCLLFVGSSGSGKTTTGLSLILAGWQLLANDTLLIEVRADGVYALPTPGGLGIREGTLGLLPDCLKLVGTTPKVQGRYELTNQQVWQGHVPEPARVTDIYFCQIEERTVSEKRPLSSAIALAQLMEQSMDRWDEKMLSNHMTMLQKLSQQANCFTLTLGQDVRHLSNLLVNNS